MGEGVEGHFGGGVLRLAQRGAIVWALEDLAVEVNRRLEPRRVIGTFPNAHVGWEVEAASLCQLLKLVLVHFLKHTTFSLSRKCGEKKWRCPHPDPIGNGSGSDPHGEKAPAFQVLYPARSWVLSGLGFLGVEMGGSLERER